MRVFAGIPLPVEAVERVSEVVAFCRKEYPRLSYVKPEGLHVTLYFFGELSEAAVSKITTVMEDSSLKKGVISGSFKPEARSFPPKGNPRVLFLGLGKGAVETAACYAGFQTLITPLGYPREGKPFIPHITFARNKHDRIAPDFLKRIPIPDIPFNLDRIVLYESVLNAKGAEYTPLKTVMLGGDN